MKRDLDGKCAVVLIDADETAGAVITIGDVAERLAKRPELLLDLADALGEELFASSRDPVELVKEMREAVVARGWPVDAFDLGLVGGLNGAPELFAMMGNPAEVPEA